MSEAGAIDCDVHPSVPDVSVLLPHLDTFWRDSVVDRGLSSLDSNSYPLKSPLTARPEWRGKNGMPAADVGQLRGSVGEGEACGHAEILVRLRAYGLWLRANQVPLAGAWP